MICCRIEKRQSTRGVGRTLKSRGLESPSHIYATEYEDEDESTHPTEFPREAIQGQPSPNH